MRLLLAGATGLIGSALLERALAAGLDIVPVGRRATGRVANEVVAEFNALPELPAADVAVCALGTTMARAGSRAAFRAVDFEAVLHFARAAQAAGAGHFIVVTAVGADPDAPVFYNRTKGEAEAALEGCGFRRLDILQPGLLLGERGERRVVEGLFQRLAPVLNPLLIGTLDRYGAIEANVVADAVLALTGMPQPGVYRHENRSLRALARS